MPASSTSLEIYRTDEGDAATASAVRDAVDGTNGTVVEVLQATQADCSGFAAQAAQQSCWAPGRLTAKEAWLTKGAPNLSCALLTVEIGAHVTQDATSQESCK